MKTRFNRVIGLGLLCAVSLYVPGIPGVVNDAAAKMQERTIEYKQGDTVLEGFLAYDDALEMGRPGILIVHEWTGIGPYVKRRARQLAQMGYVAFCADIYGKGVRPKDQSEAATQAQIYRSNRQLMRERAKAGLVQLRELDRVDPGQIAAIGYCFGGGVVLELARSGADISGVVSFHGNLDTPEPKASKAIKAKVLVCHGANDPFVTLEQVLAFQDEMRSAGIDWQMIIYGNAVHSFTNPDSGNDPSKGMAYNEKADIRSWGAMQAFFGEIFQKNTKGDAINLISLNNETDLSKIKKGRKYE